MSGVDRMVDRLLTMGCRIECWLFGHDPVVSRIGGIELSAPTCLACGHRLPDTAALAPGSAGDTTGGGA